MNDSIFGIVITFLIVGIALSAGGAAQGGVTLPSVGIDIIDRPQINAGTNTDTDAYWQYCYKMNIKDC